MADYINNNAGMDWDDAIENDGQEFIILPEGDYNFMVTGFERGRFPGSAKIPACNKATITGYSTGGCDSAGNVATTFTFLLAAASVA